MPIPILTMLVALLLASGCAGEPSHATPGPQGQNVADVLRGTTEDDATSEAKATEDTGEIVGDATSAYDDETVDVDLTNMGAEMTYATVYDMVNDPDAYRGKIVRMGGPYYHLFSEEMNKHYYRVVIEDATACCAQGIEFVWGDGTHV